VTGTIQHEGALVHREGRRPLLALGAILLGWNVFALWRGRGTFPRRSVALSLSAFGFLAQFFRVPGCTTPDEPGLVVAPAYGRLVHAGIEDEPEVIQDRRIRVSIFLSVFNPHLVRAPFAGRVVYERYHPGRYLVALHPKSSELNERNSVLIEDAAGTQVLVREIAGLLARRICSYVSVGTPISAGGEIGFIKLGSRVDVFLPENATIMLHVGNRVKAGETVIARLP
jgi:phosphatidylserine decarboxylase